MCVLSPISPVLFCILLFFLLYFLGIGLSLLSSLLLSLPLLSCLAEGKQALHALPACFAIAAGEATALLRQPPLASPAQLPATLPASG